MAYMRGPVWGCLCLLAYCCAVMLGLCLPGLGEAPSPYSVGTLLPRVQVWCAGNDMRMGLLGLCLPG
jgi:hypothetical protein